LLCKATTVSEISIDEIKDHIDEGNLLAYLEGRLGNDIDLSLLMPVTDLGAPEDEAVDAKDAREHIRIQVQSRRFSSKRAEELIDALQRRRNAVGDEGAVTRIEKNGLCFLLTSIVGLVGSGECDDPASRILWLYPELKRVVEAWPDLPSDTREAIVRMIE
jgi:hypothetical protein